MGQKILIGVTASVAIYKTLDLIRDLQKQLIDIDVVMTPDATRFIQPLMFSSLLGKEVWVDAFSEKMPHIHLSRDKDLILICPATMDFMNKLGVGICDNLLLSLCLASKSLLVLAPAMNPEMWQHPTTQNSVKVLQERGVKMIAPEVGPTLCGEEGPGRLVSNAEIISAVLAMLGEVRKEVLRACGPQDDKRWNGVSVLVTAGPTRSYLDPVRYLTNASSGQMGVALAQQLDLLGARVILALSSFASCDVHNFGGEVQRFSTHPELEKMYYQFLKTCPAGVIFAAAAPSDYEILNTSSEKMPKSDTRTVSLKALPDLVADIGRDRPARSTVIGFCVESHDLENRARQKMLQKKCDYIVANGVASVGGAQSECLILSAKNSQVIRLPQSTKSQLAAQICSYVVI